MFSPSCSTLEIPQIIIFDDDYFAAIGLSVFVQKVLGESSICCSRDLTDKSFESFVNSRRRAERFVVIVSICDGNDEQLTFLKQIMSHYRNFRFIVLVSPASCAEEAGNAVGDLVQSLLSWGTFAIIRKGQCAALKEALQAAVHADSRESCCFLRLHRVCDKWVEKYFCTTVGTAISSNAAPSADIDKDDGNVRLLTNAEKRVLSLCSLGFETEQIAEIMDISVPTVRGFLHRAKKKMRAKTRCHLIALWMCFSQSKSIVEQLHRSISAEHVSDTLPKEEHPSGKGMGKLES